MRAFLVLVWILIFGFSAEGEIINDPLICGRTKCTVPPERKFKYLIGTVYKYKYAVNVSTNLADNNQQDESTLHLDATVFLTFTSPCEGKIRLREVQLNHDRSKFNAESTDLAGDEFKTNLEKYDLQFAFNDGQVREVCSDPREDGWTLNLKKGLLSLFQNTMLRFDLNHNTEELDINGICPTEYIMYEVMKTSLIVKKRKNLNECTFSGKKMTMVQSTTYRSPNFQNKFIKNPLLRSFSDCDIIIDHNIYQKVTCNDSHRLYPLSNEGAPDVVSDFKSDLTLISENKDSDAFSDDESSEESDYDENKEDVKEENKIGYHVKRSNLLYNHRKSSKTISGELSSSKELLKSLCSLTEKDGELKQGFSYTFTKLTHSLQWLDFESLLELFDKADDMCSTGKKHMTELLLYIKSNAAVRLMKDLIMEKKVSDEIADAWITSFAMIPRPDQQTIEAVAPLLDYQDEIPKAQFVLSYSAMIHSFCIHSPNYNCLNVEVVKKFLSYLEDKISTRCTNRYHEFSQMVETLEALKAIGNMGMETDTLLEKLKMCIDERSGFVSTEVKIAAIDAHRRLSSCDKTRDYFLNHYRNSSLDSEIRIASYLQIMRCPDYNVIRIIKYTLKEEEINQVGSFVWSHLTNLLSSSSPTRIEIQSLLTDRDLDNKFNSDLRKFSRNYEHSFFSEEYNFGANHQSNLIFSTKSYIPRSATINVTLDLFGESVNIYEVSMRAEGLEYYAENLFGPTGPFGSDKVGSHFKQFLRFFRSTDNKDENYWNDVKSLPNVIDNNFENPRVSLGYKIFGNELKFIILNGDEKIRTTLNNLNPWTKIKQLLSGKEIHYENSAIIMDSSYVIPTSVGLPVKLSLSASAACNFKLTGLLNSEKLFSLGEMDFVGSIMPSINVDLTGSLIVDAFYKTAGIKIRNNVYSSGAVEARLDINGAQHGRLSIILPNDKMEIFSLRSDILFIQGNASRTIERPVGYSQTITESDTDIEIYKLTPNKRASTHSIISNTTCSWSALDRLIGLKLCSDYYFTNITKNPNPASVLFSGPILFKLSLIKADPTATSYLLEYKWETATNKSMIKVAFDTPGSHFQRELSATLTFDGSNNNVTLILQSAGNALIAKGTYKRTDDEIFIDVGLDIKGTKHLDASIGYSRKKGTHGYTYTPKLYIAINGERIAELSGTVRNQYKSNLSQCDIQLTFQTKRVWSKILGYVMKRSTSIESNLKVEYQLQKMPKKETLQLEFALANRSTKSMTHRSIKVELHSTAYPNLNAIVAAWYQQSLGHLELRVEVNSSPHLKDDRHKLTAKFMIVYSKAYFYNPGAKVSADFSITKPVQNLDIKIGVHHTSVGVDSKTIFLIRYAPKKEIILTVTTNVARSTLFNIQGHANLTIPNFNSLLINVKINERSRHEYDLEFSGTWFSGHNLTARGTYIDKSNGLIASHTLKLLLRSPSFSDDILLNCKFHQGLTKFVVSLNADQGTDKYSLVVNHAVISFTQFISYGEIRYKNTLYTLGTSVDKDREAKIEIHLDRWRDIILRAMKINEANNKEYGIEVKWDANRDPSLKLAINLQIKTHNDDKEKNVDATLTLSYPGRLISATSLCALHMPNNYIFDSSVEWDRDGSIRFLIDFDYKLEALSKMLKFESRLLSPFENWKKTSLNAKFDQADNKLFVSSSAYWLDNQTLSFEFGGVTLSRDDDGVWEWKANSKFSSTVHSIEWITADISHKQIYASQMDSRLLVKYYPENVFDVKSVWRIDKNKTDDTYNITGHMSLISPLTNYRSGELRCYFRTLPNWKFLGAANIDLNKRKYAGHLSGDIAYLKESLIEFNMTTPVEKYAYVHGRFGLSEKNRFIVAQLSSPAGPLGFEVILQLFTIAHDYNVKLLLATPVEALQKILFIAKLNNKEADFRVGYNNMTAGFVGVWFYESPGMFDYTYIFYTPIEGFEEIGVVTKFMLYDTEYKLGKLEIDTEFSIRVMELIAGFKARGGSKPPPVTIPKPEPVTEQIVSDSEGNKEDEEYQEPECYYTQENIFWRIDAEMYAVIIEPITASLDVEMIPCENNYLGVLKIPNGIIVFHDKFIMYDLMNIKNELSIDTPFSWASEVNLMNEFTSNYNDYFMQFLFNYKQNETWNKWALVGNYTSKEKEEDESTNHVVEVVIHTPLPMLKHINTKTELDFEENINKIRFLATAEDCYVNLQSYYETEENFWNVKVISQIDSPIFSIRKSKIVARIDLNGVIKQAEFSVYTDDYDIKLTNQLAARWQYQDRSVSGNMVLITCSDALKNIDGYVQYNLPAYENDTAKLNFYLKYPGKEYNLTGEMSSDKKIIADFYTPLSSARHLKFSGGVVQTNPNYYYVDGILVNLDTSKVYNVRSSISANGSGGQLFSPMVVDTVITPKAGNSNSGLTTPINVKLNRELTGLSLSAVSEWLNGTVKVSRFNYLNWDVRTTAEIRPDFIDSYKPEKVEYKFNTKLNVRENGNTSLHIHLETPRNDMRRLTLSTNFLFTSNQSSIKVNKVLNNEESYALVAWRNVFPVNMHGKLLVGFKKLDKPVGTENELNTEVFFLNPGRDLKNLNTGFDIIVDKDAWRFATNITTMINEESNIHFTVILPPPDMDHHKLFLKYKSKHTVGFNQTYYYSVSYDTEKSKKHYGSMGSIFLDENDQKKIDGHLRAEWGHQLNQFINNIFNVSMDLEEYSLKYFLRSPKYLNEDTVTIMLSYDTAKLDTKIITADVHYPASERVGYSKISFADILNINGTVNITTPLANLNHVGCSFMLLTTLKLNERKLNVFWPSNTAFVHSRYLYNSENLSSNLDGIFLIEIPLNTRHFGNVTYGYKKRPLLSDGYSVLTYNGGEIYNAKYHSKGEYRAGVEKDTVEITVSNIYQPLGIIYINTFEYSAGNAGTNYPTTESKHVNIYRLDNKTAFNLIGESQIRTTHEGQNILLRTKHGNRTVELKTDYQILPGELDHNTWLSIAEGAWISYHLNIVNQTTELEEAQNINLDIMYPKRNFTLKGSYSITSSQLDSIASLSWISENEKNRSIGSQFTWTNVPDDDEPLLKYQKAILTFIHPTFERNVTISGKMIKRNISDLFNGELLVDYAHDRNKLLILSTEVMDKSELPNTRAYHYVINGKHPRTRLLLNVEGSVNYKRSAGCIETKNYGNYKRGFYAEDKGEFSAHVDMPKYEVEFNRRGNEFLKYLKVRVYPHQPNFQINGSVVNTPTLNATGLLTANWKDKIINMMVNYTPDAVESLRMYGNIPDVRNAVFDIWRTYDEDLVVSDVSFYLKLNHSRLITSTLQWRPELRSELVNMIKSGIHNSYENMCNDIDHWKHYIKTETIAVMSDIWEDAREDISDFLDDWHNLRELEEDLEDLKKFLNNSYNANDFYIKDIIVVGVYVIDQLSLRGHIESLPNILNEIWEIMGESGEAVRKSLIWIIETIKEGYKKLSEIINAILKGESLTQIAGVIEKLVEKYDRFIKDLHVSFIKYIENLWNTMFHSLTEQWHKFLRMIEPMFIRFIHYLETIAWKASKEVLDFMYERRNEIITSPYYDKFAKLTQDIDRVYRDIKSNDFLTNISKYSTLIFQFFREKYFASVPFGKELKDIIEEIVTEIKELEKLPSVHYAVSKTRQVIDRIYYLYNYFEVRSKLEYVIRIVHTKLMEVSQSALQAENKYREAKTKFIFDPNKGLMCLEQKLPMSWHAFNRTPEFQEIPEYRAIVDMGSYFYTSNTTFWALYYHYKPYTKPSNWLPPFKARATITGSQHYITFDGRHFEFAGSCTYLLAHDFVKNHFAILIEYNVNKNNEDFNVTHKIIMLDRSYSVEIDVFQNTVKLVNSSTSLQLPTEFQNGTIQIYQDENVITIERDDNQVHLECNLKFNLCTLEVSGWYFGKTAGLFGTINNEPADDFLASNGVVVKDVEEFAQSWSLYPDQCADRENYAYQYSELVDEDKDVVLVCDQLFANLSSDFASCFPIVDATGYNAACQNSKTEEEACSVVLSYIQACKFQNTYLRIHNRCTNCQMMSDAEEVAEGEFQQLEGDLLPKSSDIVFIVEAKECNRDIKTNKSIDQLITHLNKELQEKDLMDNHWSLVIFGGDGIYNKPKNLVLDNQVFTKNTTRFIDYFNNIPVGNGNQDIFRAIELASNLAFRPGVSKTFILIPCSRCEHQNQTLDYSVLHNSLLEQGITLHVLIHNDFDFEKERFNKIFYGIDAFKAYTKKDARTLMGHTDLRRQVKLPKSMLGFCAPLALETNGTLFTGKKLRFEKVSGIKKFITVFARRVVQTAQPNPCQVCECTSDNYGTTKMSCLPCIYPSPVADNALNDLFTDNESAPALNFRPIDYSQLDVDED